ncbi:DNA polymerase thumb domain-containing protein [Halanaerobium hydrogeniformans]|uniref:DNA-directed DNA polymerase n=1 Tax=Halanaerobium hydrogeniformans TaxID=656519 RepID=E4RK90_HALHG|nr:UV-damage repair protein uvrX [Halanaerobium hydrogeniformans]ADQ14642.1 DNA-directed DNA polymerase [Halanaerobium hydrogeniformans]
MKIDYSDAPKNNILCVDMKAFYASIELVKRGLNPLENHLAVVGDKKRKGSVILAASTALKKKYGIHTGSRLFEIPKKDEIIIAEANMQLYLDISMKITEIYNSFLPLEAIHIYSIDEAWLNLNGTEKKFGDSLTTAKKIKQKIWDDYSLLCSMAVAPNMFLAKVAMDIEGKKTGLCKWDYSDVKDKLWPIKLSQCWGIGSKTEKKLNAIGVFKLGELAKLPLSYLEKKFGIIGNQLYYHAWGIDYSKLEGHYQDHRHNIGRGITLLRDYNDLEEIKTVIFNLAEEVAKRARHNNLRAKTIKLSLSFSYQEVKKGFSRQLTHKRATNFSQDIFRAALVLLQKNYQGEKVRKITLTLGNFSNNNYRQLNLFGNDDRQIKINEIRDKLEKQFGHDALFYARNIQKGSIKAKIDNTIGGHKK